jgi:hypothetical protein
MANYYGYGGLTSALVIVGLCTWREIEAIADILTTADMLLTGDGELFNVCGRSYSLALSNTSADR